MPAVPIDPTGGRGPTGGNYGLMSESDEEEDEFMDVPVQSSWAPSYLRSDTVCTRRGYRLFCRAAKCPCGRPRQTRRLRNPNELKNISLELPVSKSKRFARPDNVVVTSKYTPWDFVPRATSLQFRRTVNVFYLFQIVLLVIGYFFPTIFESPFTPFGTLGVLVFVIGVTLIFEGRDDLHRHRMDGLTNNKPAVTLDPDTGRKRKTTWGALCPGDLVYLSNFDMVPADIVVVQSAHKSGMLYIETSGIDGETNLKIRKVAPEMRAHLEKMSASTSTVSSALTGTLSCEEPNPFLNFSGSFLPADGASAPIPLGFDSLVLRGSQIRNTAWVVGIVAYAGHETKLVLSKRATPSKFATLDIVLNKIAYASMAQCFVLCVLCVLILYLVMPNTDTMWYMKNTSTLNAFALPGWLSYGLTFVIIFANVVPINMYVDVELANYVQSQYVNWDVEMYDPHTNTAARCQTGNLISEIGQVTHVFSDKTGTLTQNVMRLVGVSLKGKRYGVKVPDASKELHGDAEETALGRRVLDTREIFADLLGEISDAKIAEFLLILAVAHTVVIDVDDAGQPRYNAEGPDEEALVKAAASLGFKLMSTENDVYVVTEPSGRERSFKVLAVNGFTSDRKRMSVVVQDLQSNAYSLMLKGADSVIAALANPKVDPQLQSDLDAFAQSGLRTLLVARRSLSEEEVSQWQAEYAGAKATVGSARQAALDEVAAKLERNLQVVGATAIEDALQEGVPETIQMLRDADIKVWVLTGDKVDTAVNIGYSSKLLDGEMHQIYLDLPQDGASEPDAIRAFILDRIELELRAAHAGDKLATAVPEIDAEAPLAKSSASSASSIALIITGAAVEYVLSNQKGNKEVEAKFVELAGHCAVVLACRVSPAQKALIVRSATKGAAAKPKNGQPKPISLAIGDGANDVAMIQEARVGVGISGNEGMQAVNSSDFSIAQFKYLQRLLFVHGRWSYRRNAQIMLYVCYTWQTLNWPIFFYLFQSLVSGQQVYFETLYVTLFAWLSNYICVAAAWCDRDLNIHSVFTQPRTYDLGRLNQLLTLPKVLLGMFGRALVHAGLLYFCTVYFAPYNVDQNVLGSAVYMALVCTVMLKMSQNIWSWTWITMFAWLFWFVWYPGAISILDSWYYGTAMMFTYDVPYAWYAMVLTLGMVTLLEYTIRGLGREFRPTSTQICVEIDRGYDDPATRPLLHGFLTNGSAAAEGLITMKHGLIVAPVTMIRDAVTKKKRASARSGYDFAAPTER